MHDVASEAEADADAGDKLAVSYHHHPLHT